MIACCTSASSLCASSTSSRAFLEAAARAVEHRFDLDQAGGDGCSAMLLRSRSRLIAGLGRGDVGVACCWRVRIWTVVGPLSTRRVSGSPTAGCGCRSARCRGRRRRAGWSRRGCAGPGRRTRRRSPAAGPRSGDRPTVPATGGARLKSGGMISGALRATANSSGVFCVALEARAAAGGTAAAAAPERIRAYACSIRLLGAIALCLILTAEERAQQQDHDADANRGIADIEYQKRPPRAKMQVGEVDDIAVAHAVEDVAERAAEHHARARSGRRGSSRGPSRSRRRPRWRRSARPASSARPRSSR